MLIHQFGERDLAAATQRIVRSGNHDRGITEKYINGVLLTNRVCDSRDHQLHAARRELRVQRCRVARGDMKCDPRILPREAVNHGCDYGGSKRFGGSNSQFTCRRIGEEIEILNALPQFIEYRDSALDEGATMRRRFDTLARAFQETHPEHMFELGNQFRDRGLGHVESACRFSHAASLDDSHQYIQIPQFEPTSEAIIPWHGRRPFPEVMMSSINTIISS
jgi:hypothetical protein